MEGVLLMPIMVMAYIDPGTGSIILQVLFGSFFAGLVMIRFYWQRVKRVLGWRGATSDDIPNDSTE